MATDSPGSHKKTKSTKEATVESELDQIKLRKNINNLLERASVKQLRAIYIVTYEIVKKA